MVRIFLLRHGQTIFNTQDICQGWNDSPLTEMGLYQPKCTGYGLRKVRFTKAYSGDTQRQIDTAKQFMSQNENPVDIIPDMHFREMCYGKYQGGSYENLLGPLFKMHGDEYGGYTQLYKYMNDYEIATQVCINDETGQTEGPERAYRRFKEGLDMIINENKEGNFLISTSSAVISFVITKLFPDYKQNGLVDNASITILNYEYGKWTLEDYNNTTYRDVGNEYFKTSN